MDVSMEKGGWHLECSARDTEAVGGRNINLEGGLGLKHSHCSSLYTCSSMTDETVPSNQIDMLDTRYDFVVEEKSGSFIVSYVYVFLWLLAIS